MTRQEKENKKDFVKATLYFYIQRNGYFNDWSDSIWLFPIIASVCNCSTYYVKMIWKEIKKENPSFIFEYTY